MRSTITIRRPSASMVVALVALFAALGGTGYAAATLSGRDIQRRSIPANRVIPNALGGGQINESKLGVVPAARQALSAQTAASATTAGSATTAESAQTAQNAQQLNGKDATQFMANSVRIRFNQAAPVPGPAGGNPSEVQVSCAVNEKAIGGGGAWIINGFADGNSPTALEAPITASMPIPATGGTDNATGWHVSGRNISGSERALRAYVVCVPRTA
jgi:hypothetical protein